MQRPILDGLFLLQEDGKRPLLLAGRCRTCARYCFPARELCPYCLGENETVTVSTSGTLYSFTIVHDRPYGIERSMPYGVGQVLLPEGLIIQAYLTDCDLDRLAIGSPVETDITPIQTDADGDELVTYAFRPQVSEKHQVNERRGATINA